LSAASANERASSSADVAAPHSRLSILKMNPPQLPRFPNLDKLRGFAALSVVLYHVIEHTNWTSFPIEGPAVWGRLGWMGVDLFFVISGLVIAYSAWTLSEKYGTSWKTPFWQRRFTRIAPLYFFTMICYVCFVEPRWLTFSFKSLLHFAVHGLFIHNLFPESHGSIDGANWSIGVEMQFYLLVSLLLPWIVKVRLTTLLAVFFAIAWAWRGAVFLALDGRGPILLFHYSSQLPGTLDEFAVGIVLCKVMLDSRHVDVKNWLLHHPIHVQLISLAILTLMFFVFWKYSGYWQYGMMVALFRSLIAIAACAVVLSAITWPWAAPRWLSAPLDFSGKISYGIYLWHLPVILSLQHAGMQAGVPFLVRTVVVTIFLATVSYYLFEKLWMADARRETRTVSPQEDNSRKAALFDSVSK
jgi:peptidoglycan/LPS O-acetylase OafA/YrhL